MTAMGQRQRWRHHLFHLLTTPNNLSNSNLARYLEPHRPGTELSYSLMYSFVESHLGFRTKFAIA